MTYTENIIKYKVVSRFDAFHTSHSFLIEKSCNEDVWDTRFIEWLLPVPTIVLSKVL